MKLDHVGWTTTNLPMFEEFWCDILGFEQTHESFLTTEMGCKLFESHGAFIRRYSHPEWEVDIEIHEFVRQEYRKNERNYQNKFQSHGISHVCLHLGGPGSRQQFLKALPGDIKVHKYNNPKGWENIFIQDYEGNWIELREDFE